MEIYNCIKCGVTKKRTLIRANKKDPNKYKDENGKILIGNRCYECAKIYQKELRIKTDSKSIKIYEKTLKGYLVRTYRNMLSRVKGILKKKAHLYNGLEILDKQTFYQWSLNNKDYTTNFNKYKKSNYELRYAPSIDRIDSSKGYVLENMRWVAFHVNCSGGAKSKHKANAQKTL